MTRRKNKSLRAELLEPRLLMARPLGIDTSHWDGSINWASVKGGGYDFAWTKATQGINYIDDTLSTNMSGAASAGVLIGAYHFSNHNDTTHTAVQEANYFLAHAGSYIAPGRFIPCLDIEGTNSIGTAINQWLADFCNTVLNATGIKCIIYDGISFAKSNFDSSVTIWPRWAAVWPTSPDPQNGAPTYTTPWSTWNFWQYSSTGTVPGISGNCDLDVFNGTPAQLSQWVIPAIPVNNTPANNGATGTTNVALDWADCSNATSYDVYVDGAFKANVATSAYTIPSVTSGAHSWYAIARNNTGGEKGTIWNFTASGVPTAPTNPNPADGALLNIAPTKLDWSDVSGATSYDVYLGTNPTPFNTTISELAISPSDGVRTWRVVAKNSLGSTSGPTWTYTLDRVGPTGAFNNQTPTAGNSVLDFTVTYSDATSGINVSTLDANDMTVTGPNGYSADAAHGLLFMSVDNAANGSPRTVTYRMPAPGGNWNLFDDGVYTFTLNANQVKDVAGNFAASGSVGTMNADLPFAYKSGLLLKVDFDGTSTPITLGVSGSAITATRGATTLSFTTVANITVTGTSADDFLNWAGPISQAMSFAGNGGSDHFGVLSGVYTFNSDAAAVLGAGINLSVASGGRINFNASQHLGALSIGDGGTASLSANGNRYLDTEDLSIAPDGKLDLNDNDLVVTYGANPNLFATVKDYVFGGYSATADASRRGIISSTGQSAGNTILALLDNALVGAGDWPAGSGNAIAANSVVGKYTYFGDFNLDGQVTPDDYGIIDANFGTTPPAGVAWASGDGNLDGSVTSDDYGVIDANLGSGVGAPLAPAVFTTKPIAPNLSLNESRLRELLA